MKGVRRLGVRVGNWLTAEEGKKLLGAESADTLRSRRNRALLSLLIGCGLRRAEVTTLRFEDFQLREGPWVIADLRGKGGHIRTIPVPEWVKEAVDKLDSLRAASHVPGNRHDRLVGRLRFGQVRDTSHAEVVKPAMDARAFEGITQVVRHPLVGRVASVCLFSQHGKT